MLFEVGTIHDVNKHYRKDQFDVILIRGVLHHLSEPEGAIEAVSLIGRSVVVLEPNGYNPILKVIEKVSPYRRRHEEKSYWPPLLKAWFTKRGYAVVEQTYFCVVPHFCPAPMARALSYMEPFFERVPYIHKLYCGVHLTLYKRP